VIPGKPELKPRPGQPAAAGPEEPAGQFQTDAGDLTAAGRKLLIKKYPKFVDELGMNKVERSTKDLTPEELNHLYRRRPAWLEAVVRAELQYHHTPEAGATNFLLSRSKQSMTYVAEQIAAAAEKAGTGHQVDRGVLGEDVLDFVDRIIESDPGGQLAVLRRQLEQTPEGRIFLWGDPNATSAPSDPNRRRSRDPKAAILLGTIGNKQPDFVHVALGPAAGAGELTVIDATFAVGDNRHLFKTALYKAVLEAMTKLPTSGIDHRSRLRERRL
jgi:hypothetical protein